MNKFLVAGSAIALAAVTTLSVAAPASAAPWPYYNNYHRYHHYNYNPGFGIAAGILGFAAGAAIANSYHNGYYGNYAYGDGHVQACADAYRSYDARSDTYLGYDGYRHVCEL